MNVVTLVGKVSKSLDEKTRFIEVINILSSDDKNLLIPIRYWTNDSHNFFLTIELGKLLIVRGRIDNDDKIGLFVVAEQITVVK